MLRQYNFNVSPLSQSEFILTWRLFTADALLSLTDFRFNWEKFNLNSLHRHLLLLTCHFLYTTACCMTALLQNTNFVLLNVCIWVYFTVHVHIYEYAYDMTGWNFCQLEFMGIRNSFPITKCVHKIQTKNVTSNRIDKLFTKTKKKKKGKSYHLKVDTHFNFLKK